MFKMYTSYGMKGPQGEVNNVMMGPTSIEQNVRHEGRTGLDSFKTTLKRTNRKNKHQN